MHLSRIEGPCLLRWPLGRPYNVGGRTWAVSGIRCHGYSDRCSRSDLYSVEEFFALVADGQKADLIDGVIYTSSPDSTRADALTNLVHFLLFGFADASEAGTVHGSRYAFVLGERGAPEPDVAFVAAARKEIVTARGGSAAPDIAVEVVSRDSRNRDFGDKKRLYEQAGVREYWLVDSVQNRVEFHRLHEGRFVPVPPENNRIFRSEALPGFWLDVEWLLASPLPSCVDCLNQILGGEPP